MTINSQNATNKAVRQGGIEAMAPGKASQRPANRPKNSTFGNPLQQSKVKRPSK